MDAAHDALSTGTPMDAMYDAPWQAFPEGDNTRCAFGGMLRQIAAYRTFNRHAA